MWYVVDGFRVLRMLEKKQQYLTFMKSNVDIAISGKSNGFQEQADFHVGERYSTKHWIINHT